MEGAHEVGEVAEPYAVGDVGDGSGVVGQQARRAAQPGADQVVMRGHPEDLGEEPQEVAHPGDDERQEDRAADRRQ